PLAYLSSRASLTLFLTCSSALLLRPVLSPPRAAFLFLHAAPPPEIYPLSLHDALPILCHARQPDRPAGVRARRPLRPEAGRGRLPLACGPGRTPRGPGPGRLRRLPPGGCPGGVLADAARSALRGGRGPGIEPHARRGGGRRAAGRRRFAPGHGHGFRRHARPVASRPRRCAARRAAQPPSVAGDHAAGRLPVDPDGVVALRIARRAGICVTAGERP